LLPLLDEIGHDVTALVHTKPIQAGRTRSVTADVLDRIELIAAVREHEPEAVINLLTAIPRGLNPRTFKRQFALTNRLRSEGTANLVEASRGARMIAEGLAFAYAPTGAGLADEGRPLWTDGPKAFRPAVGALLELERLTEETRGVVLRFGHLYGPGTGFAPDGPFTEQVRAGKAPIVGDGSGRFSFTHTHDAATAIVAALEKPDVHGPLNVVDDTPLEVSRWLPAFATLVGGPAPKHVPEWIARLAVGGWGAAYMNQLVGADNRRARETLDWRPRFAAVQDGWQADYRAVPSANATGVTG
jgi:nucleoside-diphosphate-sugar epimerase